MSERYPLDHVIDDKHGGEHLPTSEVADDEEEEALANALEVARQEDHVDKGEGLHEPEPDHVED